MTDCISIINPKINRNFPNARIIRAELVWDPFGDLEPPLHQHVGGGWGFRGLGV